MKRWAWLQFRWEQYRQNKKLAQISAQLAQDLDILAGALRSGASFVQAVQIAAKEGAMPLSEEWSTLLKDIQLGASMGSAIKAFENRLPIQPIRSLASAVVVTQESGGNLAGVLVALAETIRQELTFQGKLRAMTAQGRLSSYVVSALPFVLILVLYGIAPDLIQPLFVTHIGQMMLLLVVIMISVGTVVIKKIVTIEV